MRAFLRGLDEWIGRLYSPFALVVRVHVSWVFLKSGLLKIERWDSTIALFESEYRVPLLNAYVAALAGTAAELVLPALVILGLFGRLSPLALSLLNVIAVMSYAHVLFAEGFEAAVAQHYLWGFMLLMLTIAGPGRWTVDRLLERRLAYAASRA